MYSAYFSCWDMLKNYEIDLNLIRKLFSIIYSLKDWQHFILNVTLTCITSFLPSHDIKYAYHAHYQAACTNGSQDL